MIYTVATAAALVAQSGSAGDICLLSDTLLGGIFVLKSGTITPDNGITASSPSPNLYWQRIFQGEIQASWYGAIPGARIDFPGGVATISGTDASLAINNATRALMPYPAGDLYSTIKRKIKLNNGDYVINNPVYVRKGQHLQGEGFGATVLIGYFTNLAEKNHILLGMKLNADNTTGPVDDGSVGLTPEISAFAFSGTQANRCIVYSNVQGCNIHDIWFLNVWQGINLGPVAGDTFVHSCTFDQPSRECILISGFNTLVSNCIFYRLVFGILIRGGDSTYVGSNDIQISNCKFEFNRQAGTLSGTEDRFAIKLGFGDRINNVLISNCIFTYYDSNPLQNSVINLEAFNTKNIKVIGCMFSNWSGYVIADNNFQAGTKTFGTYIENCNFDGNQSSGQYIKAVDNTGANNSKGILLRSGEYHIYDCNFINISGAPIILTGNQQITLYVANLTSAVSIQNSNTNPGTIIRILS
ncbi:MAG TPA: hypothetical protein VGP55_10745 [Chitinophagaceae bacterium]|nr:hypothetical protein [Chitinophagaceae bacterium]